MQKKHLEFNELFDVRAVRVITKRLQDCYAALGIVHTHFHHIPANLTTMSPTPNPMATSPSTPWWWGRRARRWRSRSVPSRCIRMRSSASLPTGATRKGPGRCQDQHLRRQDRMAAQTPRLAGGPLESGSLLDDLRSQVFEDGFMSSPQRAMSSTCRRATPLDFAYHVHSMIGHRCIGTKIDGRIVPFTYTLQTGDQVEVITQKEPNPSRDWMNPNMASALQPGAGQGGHLVPQADRDKNIAAGKELLEKELDRHNLTLSKVDKVVLERSMPRSWKICWPVSAAATSASTSC